MGKPATTLLRSAWMLYRYGSRFMAVPSPNQPPGGTPVNVMVWPWALSLLILSSPSTTPNQYVTGLPVHHFHWLLDHSIGFNRFVMNQLNERLGQFIAAREIDRLNNPDIRVARSLATLFNPVLYPGVGEVLRITQQELAYLVGLSRQRVNMALNNLQAEQLIRTEYGGLRVLDLTRLRRFGLPNA